MQQLTDLFQQRYQRQDLRQIRSPYRICPLGAHVDHQGGLVTGMTLDHGIDFIYASRNDGYIKVASADFPDEELFDLEQVPAYIPGSWGNYMRGAVLALKTKYKLRYGLDGLAHGSLPIGGLSSSAAVTSAYLLALAEVNGLELSRRELISLARHVENKYIGLSNGMLDQAANLLSRKDQLLFLDTRSEVYQLLPKPASMNDFEIAVVYSGISKSLISTDYNNRVDECRAAAWFLQALTQEQISSFQDVKLRDIEPVDFYRLSDQLPARFQRRALHFYSENRRVEAGLDAWRSGDLPMFGQLVFDSGDSSINNYECGCPELVTLYHILRQTDGIYGARFSGAGYRGCCIALIDPLAKDEIARTVTAAYVDACPQLADVFEIHFCRTDDGARIL